MKSKWYLAPIAILLVALIGSITGCVTIVREEPESTPEETAAAPTINHFTASPTSINQGQRTTLSWDVSGVNKVTIEPEIGTIGPTGSLQLSPSADITYTLTAANEAGSTTASASVIVFTSTGKPDLVITDVWLTGSVVNYKIANRGNADAKPTQSYFYVNGQKQATDWVDSLAAGEERTTSFSNFDWAFPGAAGDPDAAVPTFTVKVCANTGNDVEEINEDNNCLTKIWGQTFTYDFVQNAHMAEWRSSSAVITWPKFAGNQQGSAYSEGNALITCPEQVSNGWIQGKFGDFYYDPGSKTTRSRVLEVPENARFIAEVGFKQGVTSTDGVKIALGYVDEAGGIVLFPEMELYPGETSRDYTVDLSYLAGKKTEFVLRVEAKNSPEGDCVKWKDAKIVQE